MCSSQRKETGRSEVTAKLCARLYLLQYDFLQKWPKTQAQADNENSGDDGGA